MQTCVETFSLSVRLLQTEMYHWTELEVIVKISFKKKGGRVQILPKH